MKHGTTARDLLFANPATVAVELERALTNEKVLDKNALDSKAVAKKPDPARPLSAAASRFVMGQVVEAIDGLLGAIGAGGLLVDGWNKMERIEEARRTTRLDHGVRNVSVMTHEITSCHEPRVELLVNESPVPLLHLRLDAKFTVEPCELLVRDGEIIDGQLGSIRTDCKLSAGSATLIHHQIARLELLGLFEPPPAAPGTEVQP